METFDFNMPGGSQKWTPLHLAAHIGNARIVQEIIGSGTN